MNVSARNGDVVERIFSANAPVVLLRGPAATGKTRAMLESYRRLSDEVGRSAAMLLAPNVHAVERYRRRLLDESPTGVLVSPQVHTFAALAGRILVTDQRAIHALSPLGRHLLLRRIVRDLASADELAALGGIVETPGLVPALEMSIAELKRAAVEPDELAAAVGREGRSRDLLEIYRRYQEELRNTDTYDLEGRMWLVRDRLAGAAGPADAGLEGVRLVAADGFTDFTPTQLEILAHLARLTGKVVLTLPLDTDGRDRLWHWTGRTLESIRGVFGDTLAEIELQPDAPDAAPLRAMWDRAFTEPADGKPPEEISIIAAPDIDAEVSAVATRAKRLLASGTPAGRIAVVARSMEPYREAVERIFEAHDVPVRPAPMPLTDVPIVRFALAAAALPAADYTSHDVLRVIKSSYFRPEALGGFDETTAAAAEAVIRQGNVLQGRASYALAAERLAARRDRQSDTAQKDEDDDEPGADRSRFAADTLRSAGAMLEALFEMVSPAGREQISRTAALADLPDKLHLREAACDAGSDRAVARDLRALDELAAALGEIDAPPEDPAELSRALSAVVMAALRTEELVDVLDVLDARAIRYDHVFLLGAGEGVFPRKFTESSLIQESDRLRWSRAGVRLDRRDEIARREMLLFYLAATRADKTLTFSYQAPNGSDEGTGISPLLLSLLEPFGGLQAAADAGRVETIPPGRFVPPADEICRRRDALNAAVAGLFGPYSDPGRCALGWAAAEADEQLSIVARGLWANHRRWTGRERNEFDGRISDPQLLEFLDARFGREAVFSASRLNNYGQCPWLFFATHVLMLEPPLQPQRRLEPVARGLFVHAVLRRTFETLRERAGGPVRLGEIDETELAEALDSAVNAESDRMRPPYPALWQIQRDRMRDEMHDYLRSLRERADAEAVYLELAFGLGDGPDGYADPASSSQPAELETSAGKLRIHGRIDRMDRSVGAEPEWLVIDYKTGSLPSVRDIEQGRSLQLPLYSAAVEVLFDSAEACGEFHRIGGKGELRRFGPGGKVSYEEFIERRDEVLARAAGFVEGIRSGRFDLAPTAKCPYWCPMKQICRVSSFRLDLRDGPEDDDD